LDFLPLFLNVRGRSCVVVGGGVVATRKAALLCRAGAALTVVAPRVEEALRELVSAHGGNLALREFDAGDLAGCTLLVAATDDAAENARVAALARARDVLVNVVDQPADCTAIMPAIVDRSPVLIAIGTGGNAPVLARMLRAKLETLIPPAYGELAGYLGGLRARVRDALPDATLRRRWWETVVDGPIAELFFAGRRQAAADAIDDLLERGPSPGPKRGEVYLIGTGPGDPDLLTFRALRLMQIADVVVHDRLVGESILDLCRRDAERVFVGKARTRHAMVQEDINGLLARLARAGKRVARLKGGDPFIFGRGGEEIEHLAALGIDFQVVPGITAAVGCAAYAGIPLTHRDHAQSCLFVTAHQKDAQLEVDWTALLRPRQTVVVYMGVAALPQLVAGLLERGADPATPAALVERGTTARQRTVAATLGELPARAAAIAIESPALVFIGSVVTLRERLAWFVPADAPA
jgi:uroporphyrin-III C-methyltransferase/precorrin-2 dehydrogenase/sirohydrochlorin ferrochelatase